MEVIEAENADPNPHMERMFGDLKSDLRLAIDRMGSQQATLAEWRTALEAALVEVSTLASVPDRLAAIARVVESSHEAHLRTTQDMVGKLVRPLIEEWAQTRVDVTNLSGKLDRLGATLAGGLSQALEAQGHQLGARLEHGQRESSKLHQEVLTTHLEGILAVQRQLVQTVEASIGAGLEHARQDQAARTNTLERNLSAMLKTLVGENLANDVEALPEVLVGALSHMAEENGRRLMAQVEQMSEQNRQALGELTRAAFLQNQETTRALTSTNELATRDLQEVVKTLTSVKRSVASEVKASAQERVAAMAELESACERIEIRLLDAQRQESSEPDALDARLTQVQEQLEALQKLARSIDRKTAKVAASALAVTAKPAPAPPTPRSRATKPAR